MPSNEHPDMSGNPMDDPDLCDQCEKAISDFARFGTELDEDKNFCSLECMEAYNEKHNSLWILNPVAEVSRSQVLK